MSVWPDAAPQGTDEHDYPSSREDAPAVTVADVGGVPAGPVEAGNGGWRRAAMAVRVRRTEAPAAQVEVRRVRRVLRRLDTWSVFRFAVLFYGCGLVVFLAAAVGLWIVASAAGAIPSIEHFITQLFALKHFSFKSGQLFLGTLGIGLVGVFVATLFTVITAVLYNLISDVVGGIEITVLEEHPIEVVR